MANNVSTIKKNDAASSTEVAKKNSMLAETARRFMRNKVAVFAFCVLIFLVLVAIIGPFIAPYGMDEQNVANRLQGISAEHWFGTDDLGRDVFTRIIYGARTSLLAGFAATTMAIIGGMILGSCAGYFGGVIDTCVMRFVELMMGIPGNLLAIVLCAVLGASLTNCLIATAISTAPAMSRMIRGQILSESTKEYIEAEHMINAGNFRIIFSHILPNISSTIIVQYTMGIANAIMMCSGLSFIGLGAQAPTAEWGAMLSGGRTYIRVAPHICIFPGVAIMMTVFSLNVIGDGLRDALDPRLKN